MKNADADEPEPEPDDTVAGNAVWRELCGLLEVEDEAIVDAGRTEDVRLLRLRADLDEESMTTVEEIAAEKDEAMGERDQAMTKVAEKDKVIAEMVAERDEENAQTVLDRDTAIADKDKAIAEMVAAEKLLAEKDKAIEERDVENARLKEQLAAASK